GRAQLMTHAGEKLGFRLARGPRFLLRELSLFDVNRDAKPGLDIARRVPAGPAAREKPAVFVVLAPQPHLDLVVAALLYRGVEAADDALTIFGMNRLDPLAAERLFLGKSGELVPVLIRVSDASIGAAEPHDLRRELEEILESGSRGLGPTLEACGCERNDEERNAGNGDYQSELVTAENQIVCRTPVA